MWKGRGPWPSHFSHIEIQVSFSPMPNGDIKGSQRKDKK